MLVLLAEHLPEAMRGRLKLWFVEPRPNVFVSGLKEAAADKVMVWLLAHCPPESGLLALKKTGRPPGYEILSHGQAARALIKISGLDLPAKKPAQPDQAG
jgi:CRISPR-associated protein Cas2